LLADGRRLRKHERTRDADSRGRRARPFMRRQCQDDDGCRSMLQADVVAAFRSRFGAVVLDLTWRLAPPEP